MEKSKLTPFYKRAITSIILAPVVLLLLYLGSPYLELLVFTCGVLLAWEWANMVPNKNVVFYSIAYTSTVAVATLMNYFITSLIVVLVMTLLVAWKAKKEQHRWLLTLGNAYIAIGVGALVWLYQMSGGDTSLMVWYVLVIWSVDIGGYLVGTTLKGPKLAPKVSPNKTWSGLVGGMLLAAIVSVAYTYWQFAKFDYGWNALIIASSVAAVLAVIAQIGDLIESKIKRYLGIKDSSNLIPGHGGVFDRVDGLIFAAPCFLLVVFVIFVFANTYN